VKGKEKEVEEKEVEEKRKEIRG